jgi:hypothetical protein
MGFGDAPARPLPLPVPTDYTTLNPEPPAHDGLLTARIAWPALRLADDNGDGRPDLFALSRFAVWVFVTSGQGLPSAPTRKLALRPFTLDEELRHETTALRAIARDIDGDGLADLVIDRGAGTLLRSRHSTEIYFNRGRGVALSAAPDARIQLNGSLAVVDLVDLDGDGRIELFQTTVTFGIIQLIRMLVTRRIEADLRVYALAGPGAFGVEPAWSGRVSLRLDFAAGRVADLTPTTAGDWNGDRIRDLLYGAGTNRLGIRLGRSEGAEPGFGSQVATQDLPEARAVEVFDVDGDGLDDLILFDRRDLEGRIHILRNRGVLPGTPPRD